MTKTDPVVDLFTKNQSDLLETLHSKQVLGSIKETPEYNEPHLVQINDNFVIKNKKISKIN